MRPSDAWFTVARRSRYPARLAHRKSTSADSRYSSSPSTIRVPPPKKHSALVRNSASSAHSAASTIRCRARAGSDIEHPIAIARGEPLDQRALGGLHVALIDQAPVTLVEVERLFGAQIPVAAVPAQRRQVFVSRDLDQLLVEEPGESPHEIGAAQGHSCPRGIPSGQL